MGFIESWLMKVFDKRIKKKREEWMTNLEKVAQKTDPVEVEITTWTPRGKYGILVNGTEVSYEFAFVAAHSKERLIRGLLRSKGYTVV